MVPIVYKSEEENAQNSMGDTSEFKSNYSDELLINLVKERPALFDIRIPLKERTKIMKQALWYDVSKNMNGQLKPDAAEVRWKYLRENYLKARKKQKIKEEIARRNGIPLPTCNKNRKYSFRYYEIMRFLDDSLDYQKILTMQNAAKSKGQKHQIIIKNQLDASSIQVQEMQQVEPMQQVQDGDLISIENAVPYEEINVDNQIVAPSSPFTLQASELDNSSNAKSNYNFNSYDQIFLECLQKPIEKPSPIDGFLIRLGEGLRRLPYRERSKLELEFLTRLNEVEEQLELY